MIRRRRTVRPFLLLSSILCAAQVSVAHAQGDNPTASAPAASEAPRAPDRFPIYAIDVTGVKALTNAEIERIVYPSLGPDKGPADVQAARAQIEKAYHAKGYEAVTVVIPQQPTDRFVAGVVQIDVYEAPVANVTVSDAKHHSTKGIAESLTAIQPGKALNLAQLQSQIDAQNRFPDRTITPAFEPGTEPGTVDVKLNVDDKFPLHASAELNNDNSPSTTRMRASASLRYTNLWGAGHTLSGTVLVSPENRRETEVFSGSYTAPLIGTPWTLLLYGYKSNSNIAALGGTNVLGKGYQVGLRAVLRLPSKKTFQTLSFGPDFKDFEQNITSGSTVVGAFPIRYIPITAEYGISGTQGKLSYDASLGATLGLRVIKRQICSSGSSPCIPVDQFRDREVFSYENFARFNLGLNATLTLPEDFAVAAHLQAQLADSHLATNEQFSIGGLSTLRGYFQSEAVGDDGVVGGLEVRSPPISQWIGKPLSDLRVYTFVEGGIVHTKRASPGTRATDRLLAVGGGARIQFFDVLTGEFIVGVPLVDGPTSQSGDVRSVFVVRAEF